ncbi:MAG: hypothetical protein VKP62_09175 [Candidatus Sericytochromatia bacterium]|nr:hypothetical protein [Candidatus Sericytochromatia bacterium]
MKLTRPLTSGEREGLTLAKARLDQAFQAQVLTWGLIGLPLGFVALGLRAGPGQSGDRMALLLSAIILLALIAAVLSLGTPRNKQASWRPGDWSLRRRLAHDLSERCVVVASGEVTGKRSVALRPWWQWRVRPDAPRRYFIQIAGHDVEVTAARWLTVSLGEQAQVAFASHSGWLLEFGGLPERLAITPPVIDVEPNNIVPFKPG